MNKVQKKVIKYTQQRWEDVKQEVEIGANGTQKYVVKKGPNKGKVV